MKEYFREYARLIVFTASVLFVGLGTLGLMKAGLGRFGPAGLKEAIASAA